MVENSPKWSRWLKVVQSQSFAAQFIRKRRWIQYLGLDFNALATKDRLQALDEESHAYRFFLKSCHNNISLHKKKIQNRNVRSSRFLRKYTFSLYFFVAAGALKALKALISTPGALKSLISDHPSCQWRNSRRPYNINAYHFVTGWSWPNVPEYSQSVSKYYRVGRCAIP